MAFAKTANARIVRASLGVNDWNAIKSGTLGGRTKISSDVNMSEYSPDKYLLTHCTIIASVDVEEDGPTNEQGWHYFLTAVTEQYINNNEDCWERDLLLVTFHTFRGAENYVEHIQIPELSKGKIVDAVARDIGNSIYVDILVATNRKHTELVSDIETEKIATLSMGCTVEYTICTKCGNKAVDDTELCACIKYQKGNHFYDRKGRRRKIAELCGHKSDPESVSFIEASWVANPAFKGAVMRNIISPEDIEEAVIKAAFETDKIVDAEAMQKAASVTSEVQQAFSVVSKFIRSGQFDFGDAGGEEEEGGEEAAPAEAEVAPLDELADDVKEFVRGKVRKELREELQGTEPAADTGSEDSNDSLVESSVRVNFGFTLFKSRFSGYGNDLMLYRLYEGLVTIRTSGWKALPEKAFTGREILALSHFIDSVRGKTVLTQEDYETISKIGGTKKFENPVDYLNACGRDLGVQKMSTTLAKALIYKGQLYSYGVDT